MVWDDWLTMGIFFFFLASRITVLKLFDLMAPFYFTKLLRASKSFCVYELYLSIFAVLENKAEKLLKCLSSCCSVTK